MKEYIPNILLAAATSLFFYHGAEAYIAASKLSTEAAQLEQVDDSQYLKQSLEEDAKRERTTGTARCGFGGLMLLVSGVDAYKKRKEQKLEKKLEESSN